MGIFVISLIYMNIIIYKKGKHSNHLTTGEKPCWTRASEIFIYLTCFPMTFIWPFMSIGYLKTWLWHNDKTLFFVGLFFNFLGVIIYSVAIITLGTSWRLGIDPESDEELVQKGIYSHSRHPAYLGFFFMFLGVALSFSCYVTVILFVLSVISFINMARVEEEFLLGKYGDPYKQYMEKVSMIWSF